MTRGTPRPAPDDPERKCLVTGEVSPKRGLIRFVVGPGDAVYPDIAGKLPGRGMYVSAEREADSRKPCARSKGDSPGAKGDWYTIGTGGSLCRYDGLGSISMVSGSDTADG